MRNQKEFSLLNNDQKAALSGLGTNLAGPIQQAPPVKRPQCVETTAMGAAYLAGLAVGYWKDKEDVVNNQKIDRIFTPEMEEEERKAKRKGWNKAVKYAYGWAKDEPEEEEE